LARRLIVRSPVFALAVITCALAGCDPDPDPQTVARTETAQTADPVDSRASRVEAVLRNLDQRNEEIIQEPDELSLLESDNNERTQEIEATYEYLQAVIRHADRVWSAWFSENQLQEPRVGYRIIRPGETYTTRCGGGEVVDAFYDNAFYCASDPNSLGDTGMVVLPVDTFRRMWTWDIFGQLEASTQRVGDFAAGAIAAHEFGHHVADELATQARVAPPRKPNSELLADCFAGVWSYSVFLDNYLEEGDIEEAVSALSVIGDDLGDHGTGRQRQNAFMIGYTGTTSAPGGGRPERCIETYWP
jgi:predicted metalloprotease